MNIIARISIYILLIGGFVSYSFALSTLSNENAFPDSVIQGEYYGKLKDGEHLGAWVRGEPDGFLVSFLPGGLISFPGQNFGTMDSAKMVVGKFKGQSFSINGYTGNLSNINDQPALIGKTKQGQVFTLKKINRSSPTLGIKPPSGAIVLFGDKKIEDLKNWTNAEIDTINQALLRGGHSKHVHGSIQLHIEFRLPFWHTRTNPNHRGNSGVYFQDRYEIQVIDHFGLTKKPKGLGAVYHPKRLPIQNSALPPLAWQTLDCYFHAAEWNENNRKIKKARITSYLNGVLVQDDVEIGGTTLSAGEKEKPHKTPLFLQRRGPILYNNIWILEKDFIPFDELLKRASVSIKPESIENKKAMELIDFSLQSILSNVNHQINGRKVP